MVRHFVLVGMVAASFVATGCREEKQPAKSPPISATSGPAVGETTSLRIAVIPKSVMREFWKTIHAGAIKAELELPNVQTIWKGPLNENDRVQQINVVEDFLNAGVSGIVLAPLDSKALVGIVKEAAKAGIPVAIMDSNLDAAVGKDYVSFVATDNYVGGVKAGRYLGKILGSKGKVLMMRHMVGSASTNDREQGFLDTMAKEFPELKVVSSDQYAGPTQESAMAKAESLLARFPELDGVFCPNDTSAFGMLRALQESGRAGKIKFVAFDAVPKLVDSHEKRRLP